jgi:phage terminase large subunit-like protein
MQTPTDIEQYIKGVLEGTLPACEFIKLAVERHQRDLHRAAIGDASFDGCYFDFDAGQRVIDFVELLQPSKGEWANQPLKLLPWQKWLVYVLFGWKRKDGFRRFSIGYIENPRKNGKTTLLAAIGLYMVFADDEPGAEVYSAATTKDQARQIFDEAVAMVDNSLKKYIERVGSKIVNELRVSGSKSKFKPLAADSSKLDGLNVHCGLVDEMHEHPDKKVWEKLKTATGSRRQSLLVGITTAGVGRESFCYRQGRLTSERILKRDQDNDSFFAFIACADDETKWDDPREWAKANPSLGVSVKEKVLQDEFLLAKNNPDELNDFLRYHLNIWTEKIRVWMPMGKDGWTSPACMGTDAEFPDAMFLREELLKKLKGRTCCGGLDLSATIDLTAFVLVFSPTEEITEMVPDPEHKGKKKQVVVTPADPHYYVLPFFWIPEANVEARSKRDHVRYDIWTREGFIETTPGNAVDYAPVCLRILELAKDYDIREIAFDRWGSQEIVQFLQNEGLTVAKFGQGMASMSDPMKSLLKAVLKGEIVHAANPVLRWNAANVVVEQDAAGGIKPDKEKSPEKIDGIVATVMALSRAELYKDAAQPEFFTLK